MRESLHAPVPAALIVIPRGLESVPCRHCGEPVYWAPSPASGRVMAVSYAPDVALGCRRPTGHMDGRGISHAVTCLSYRKVQP